MLELEALGLDRAHTEVSVQYVDHNLLQADSKNAEDDDFSVPPPDGSVCGFRRPETASLTQRTCSGSAYRARPWSGSDSHTPAAGSLGMLAIGVGGTELALAIAGEPLYLKMPEIWGVRLIGNLPPWTSAKDVILVMLLGTASMVALTGSSSTTIPASQH